jgi:predicted amidophosphoribosyltransferase
MLAEVVALVVPPRCCACRAPGRRAADVLCAACRRALPWLAGPCCPRCALSLAPTGPHRCPARRAAFESAWAAVAYDGAARDAMHALKFAGARPLADLMAAQIAANAPAALLRGGGAGGGGGGGRDSGGTGGLTIVAVPPHPRRRRRRGFDPAELIAVALARRTGLPLRRALRRSAAPSHQLGASRDARRDPGRLHFAARGPAPPRVVLVDDVHTTGATLHACAQALRDAGARHVGAITWARTLDERLR